MLAFWNELYPKVRFRGKRCFARVDECLVSEVCFCGQQFLMLAFWNELYPKVRFRGKR